MILVTPRTTEKAYGLSAGMNVYVFDVPANANKEQIATAVSSQYEVNVTDVRVLVQKGKSIRYSRGKNRYPGNTHRPDTKKAYVTLAKDNTIPVFAGSEQEAK